MQYSEEDLIDSLYKLYEQPMYHEAYKILHDEHLSEDAVHESFLRLIRNREKIKDPNSLKVRSYVYKTVKSSALDIYRMQKKERERYCEYTEATDFLHNDDDIDTSAIFSMMSELPQKYAVVLNCLFINELSIRETSAVLKISEVCVRKRCERARKLLKNIKTNKED